jgi:hypothetical protein
LIREAKRRGSPNESQMARAPRSSAMSQQMGLRAMLQVMKPTPKGGPAFASGAAERAEFILQPRVVAITTAQKAEAAGVRDGQRQARVGDEVHRRQEDRVLDSEDRIEWGIDGHDNLCWTRDATREVRWHSGQDPARWLPSSQNNPCIAPRLAEPSADDLARDHSVCRPMALAGEALDASTTASRSSAGCRTEWAAAQAPLPDAASSDLRATSTACMRSASAASEVFEQTCREFVGLLFRHEVAGVGDDGAADVIGDQLQRLFGLAAAARASARPPPTASTGIASRKPLSARLRLSALSRGMLR